VRFREQSRSRYWRLLPLAAAVVCVVVSFFVPTDIGNWLVVGGIVIAVAFFGPAIRSNGGARFFSGRR
jgi:ABC-type Co2+ transport system permease subunit